MYKELFLSIYITIWLKKCFVWDPFLDFYMEMDQAWRLQGSSEHIAHGVKKTNMRKKLI